MADDATKAAKNRAYWLLEQAETKLESGEIDEDGWYREVAAVITPAYLAGDNPRSQSGNSGDDAHWDRARSLIADAVDHDGTFLDVGCASGYLMETIQRWTAAKGLHVEPYGLDIAPELAELARTRLPHWAYRIFVGNGLTWTPPTRYDYVRTGLEYVPLRRRRDLVAHLLGHVVAPGGRLIIGTFNEENDACRTEPALAETVAGWGFAISGRSDRPKSDTVLYRVFWIDAPPAA